MLWHTSYAIKNCLRTDEAWRHLKIASLFFKIACTGSLKCFYNPLNVTELFSTPSSDFACAVLLNNHPEICEDTLIVGNTNSYDDHHFHNALAHYFNKISDDLKLQLSSTLRLILHLSDCSKYRIKNELVQSNTIEPLLNSVNEKIKLMEAFPNSLAANAARSFICLIASYIHLMLSSLNILSLAVKNVDPTIKKEVITLSLKHFCCAFVGMFAWPTIGLIYPRWLQSILLSPEKTPNHPLIDQLITAPSNTRCLFPLCIKIELKNPLFHQYYLLVTKNLSDYTISICHRAKDDCYEKNGNKQKIDLTFDHVDLKFAHIFLNYFYKSDTEKQKVMDDFITELLRSREVYLPDNTSSVKVLYFWLHFANSIQSDSKQYMNIQKIGNCSFSSLLAALSLNHVSYEGQTKKSFTEFKYHFTKAVYDDLGYMLDYLPYLKHGSERPSTIVLRKLKQKKQTLFQSDI
jgi:hypothetical protein